MREGRSRRQSSKDSGKESCYFSLLHFEDLSMGKRRSFVGSPRRSPSNRQSPVVDSENSLKILVEEGRPRPGSRTSRRASDATSPVDIPGTKEDGRYAGPKFSSPPSADLLPKPPSKWISCHRESFQRVNLDAMTVHLRQMLKMSTA